MADKSLQRQVFPPGLVGDLMSKAAQFLPVSAPQRPTTLPTPPPAPVSLATSAKKVGLTKMGSSK